MSRNRPLTQEELAKIIEEMSDIECDISEDKDGESSCGYL